MHALKLISKLVPRGCPNESTDLADVGDTVDRMRLLSADDAMLWLRDNVEM